MKVAFITGAGGGIGSATVKKFINDGYFVVGQYNKNKAGIDNLISQLKADEKVDYFFAVQCDFNDKKQIDNMISVVNQSFKRIDGQNKPPDTVLQRKKSKRAGNV